MIRKYSKVNSFITKGFFFPKTIRSSYSFSVFFQTIRNFRTRY